MLPNFLSQCFFPCRTGNQTEFKILPVDQDEAAGLVNQQGLSRKNIFAAVNASLKRLQLDYIDVLQCHRFDKSTWVLILLALPVKRPQRLTIRRSQAHRRDGKPASSPRSIDSDI